jgi:hypothetical protein
MKKVLYEYDYGVNNRIVLDARTRDELLQKLLYDFIRDESFALDADQNTMECALLFEAYLTTGPLS